MAGPTVASEASLVTVTLQSDPRELRLANLIPAKSELFGETKTRNCYELSQPNRHKGTS